MAYVIGVVSQKGGVGKSTIARMLAREVETNDAFTAKIADLDSSQGTSFHWAKRRRENGIQPDIRVETFGVVKTALADVDNFDFLIFDGAPHATKETLEIAVTADIIVIPTGASRDDLDPNIVLAHELADKGISPDKILFVLSKIDSRSGKEQENARKYINRAGYLCSTSYIEEKRLYRTAGDDGRALTETKHEGLDRKANDVAQEIMDFLTAQVNKRAAA